MTIKEFVCVERVDRTGNVGLNEGVRTTEKGVKSSGLVGTLLSL